MDDDDWGVKPPLAWKSLGKDPVAVVAKKFNLLPFTVRKMMANLEKVHRLKIEQKLELRLHRASDFLKWAYDQEAKQAKCKACDSGPWDTWDEMQAHVRCHILLDFADDAKLASAARSVGADMDKLMYPQYKMSLRQKRTGILPPDEDAEELQKRVAGRLGPGS